MCDKQVATDVMCVYKNRVFRALLIGYKSEELNWRIKQPKKKERYLKQRLRMMIKRYLALPCLLSFVTLAAIASAVLENYGISDSCLCSFQKIPKRPVGHRCVNNPGCYPDHEILNITAECMPSIPDK